MTIVDLDKDGALSRALPHTLEAGDPYYIGDCYERSTVPGEWEIDSRHLPYLTHIKALSHSWKPLRYLADFMEVGTSPLRWKDLKNCDQERKERSERVNLTYLKCMGSKEASRTSLQDAKGLRETASRLTSEQSEAGVTHILVVEDLSRAVIEILGGAFNIDPLFFREQIDEYSWYNTRDPWANPPSLMSTIKRRNWFRMRNVRLHYFESQEQFEQARQESNLFNILRRPDDDQNHWHYLDKPGSIVSLTRTKTSVWIGSTGGDGKTTIGIVLVDPTILKGRPLWYGHTNWLPTPSLHSSSIPPTRPSASLCEELIDTISTYPWSRPISSGVSCTKPAIVLPALCATAAEWLVVCDYVKARLGQIEWELEKPGRFRSKGDIIDASLQRLHVWRRVLPVYREMVSEALQQTLPLVARLFSTSTDQTTFCGESDEFEYIVEDFERVRDALNELQARVDRLTSIVTSEISIEDSRRGLQENHNVAKLTWMATTFIPLSFVTGLFSMESNLADLQETFGWYFLTALPLTIIILVAAGRVGRGWHMFNLTKYLRRKKE